MITVPCGYNDYFNKICDVFNIHEYPSIRHVSNNKIREYYGKLDAESIKNQLKF